MSDQLGVGEGSGFTSAPVEMDLDGLGSTPKVEMPTFKPDLSASKIVAEAPNAEVVAKLPDVTAAATAVPKIETPVPPPAATDYDSRFNDIANNPSLTDAERDAQVAALGNEQATEVDKTSSLPKTEGEQPPQEPPTDVPTAGSTEASGQKPPAVETPPAEQSTFQKEHTELTNERDALVAKQTEAKKTNQDLSDEDRDKLSELNTEIADRDRFAELNGRKESNAALSLKEKADLQRLDEKYGKKPENPPAAPKTIQERTTEIGSQISVLEAKGDKRSPDENAQLAQLQADKIDLDQFSALKHRKLNAKNNPAINPLTAEEQKRYDQLNAKLNPEDPANANNPEKLRQESEALIENIRNGEGDLTENFMALEDVTRRMRGEAGLTANLRKALADVLQQYANGEGSQNEEAKKVIERIGELYGLELQLEQLPEQLKVLDGQADELDEVINKNKDTIGLTDKTEAAKKRKIVYDSYVKLTMVEAQMSQLMVIDKEILQRFKETSNYLDFHLGRQNIVSYAFKGVVNQSNRGLMDLSRPSLRSTRHKGFLGFKGFI